MGGIYVKILPLELQEGIFSECWSSYIVAAALPHEGTRPWFLERFVDFYVPEDLAAVYYQNDPLFGPFADYDEILEYESIDWQRGDLISLLIDRIDNDRYIMISCLSQGYLHEIMLVGYDESSFYYYRPASDHGEVLTIPYSELWSSFACAVEAYAADPASQRSVLYHHLPLSCFHIKEVHERPIRMERIEGAVFEMAATDAHVRALSGSNQKGEYFYHGDGLYVLMERIIRSIADGTDEEWALSRSIKVLKKLQEARLGLTKRLSYCQQDWDIVLDRALMSQYDEMIKRIALCRCYLMKFETARERRYLFQAIDLLDDICRRDSYCLNRTLLALRKGVNDAFAQQVNGIAKLCRELQSSCAS